MKFQKIEFQVLILITTKKNILDYKYYTYILTYQVQYLPSGYPTQSINQPINLLSLVFPERDNLYSSQ